MVAWRPSWLVLSCAVLASGCARTGFEDLGCEGQRCSGHGRCGVFGGSEYACLCDPGYVNDGPLACVSPFAPDASTDAAVVTGDGAVDAAVVTGDGAVDAAVAQEDGAIADAAGADAGTPDRAENDAALPPGPIARGVLDPDFAGDGVHSESGYLDGNVFHALLVDPAGHLYAAGRLQAAADDWGDVIIQKFLPDGAPDTSFNTTGTRIFDWTPFELPAGLSLNAAGQLMVGGAYTVQENPWVMRLNPDGSTDTSWGSGGLVVKTVAGEKKPNAMAVDPVDGSFYLVGDDYGDQPYAVKFTATGQVDVQFNGDGYLQLPPVLYGAAQDIVVDRAQRVVIVGYLRPNGAGDDQAAVVWRLDPYGRADESFDNPQGYVHFDDLYGAGQDDSFGGVALGDDGSYIVTGSMGEAGVADLVVVKLDGDGGSVDASFGDGGIRRIRSLLAPGAGGAGARIALDAAGNLLVAGRAYNGRNNDLLVLRLLPDGALDSRFGDGGKVVAASLLGADGDEGATCLATDALGAIYVGGHSKGTDGFYDAVLIKID